MSSNLVIKSNTKKSRNKSNEVDNVNSQERDQVDEIISNISPADNTLNINKEVSEENKSENIYSLHLKDYYESLDKILDKQENEDDDNESNIKNKNKLLFDISSSLREMCKSVNNLTLYISQSRKDNDCKTPPTKLEARLAVIEDHLKIEEQSKNQIQTLMSKVIYNLINVFFL